MTLTVDTVSLQPIAAPIAAPLVRQPVAAVSDRDSTGNERRESSRERSRTTAAFRSFLNAATLAGLTQTLGNTSEPAVAQVSETARQRKVPNRKATTELSADESDNLYQSAQAFTKPSNARASEFLSASTRYAKSFFSVSGTFAKPGENLELTA